MLVVVALYSFCVWNQMPWRNLRTIVLPQHFLHVLLRGFDRLSKCVKLCIYFSENSFDFSHETS